MDILFKIEEILANGDPSHALSTPLGRLMAEMALIDTELTLVQCNLSKQGREGDAICREVNEKLEAVRKGVYTLRQSSITTAVGASTQQKPKIVKFNPTQPADINQIRIHNSLNKGNILSEVGIIPFDVAPSTRNPKSHQKSPTKRLGFYAQDPLENIKK